MAISKNFVLKEVAGDYMIIPLVNGGMDMSKVFNINEVGAIIYKGLQNDKTDEEIVVSILSEYNVNHDDALADVKAFKEALKKKGIYND